MTKLKDIITDGIILFTASTALVVVADVGFGRLKTLGGKDSALVASISNDDTAGLRRKLSEGAETNEADSRGRTALMWAAYANLREKKILAEADGKRVEMTGILLQAGADPNRKDVDGWTPLMWAAWSGLDGVAKELLAHGARADVRDSKGVSALRLAAARGFPGIVRRIEEKDSGDRENALAAARAGLLAYPEKKADYEEIIRTLGG